ncbi:poly(A)-specific ribonuclease [Malassezia cuniculi]|uniref:PAN2-PAN3 deadenylation complex catalytic subunit PAN2 n=1 Tax=Malassezia cuniculi TaxID=948313 RepID=A0AAF0J6D4_9BASI|nr:poly(A)-specific ribonuclease [Malassezia cuniculi]
MAEWAQQAHLLANHAAPGVNGAVSALYFDTYTELLWTGSASGQVTSHTNTPPTYPRYTSYAAHGTVNQRAEVLRITGNEKSIFSVSQDSVRAVQRSGLGRWTVRMADHAPGLQLASMCDTPLSTSSDIFVGGATAAARRTGVLAPEDQILAINTNAATVTRSVPSEAPLTHLRRAGRVLCAGTAGGAVQIRDPRTLAIENRLNAHHGGLTDMQADGHFVYTIGWTLRQGQPVTEPFLKVFDLRTMQSLVPIPLTAPGGPALLAVHPKRSSLLAVATPQAQFQIVDTNLPGQSQFYMLNSVSYISALAFSPAADTLAFGESDGSVRLWTNDSNAIASGTPVRFNAYALPPPPMADVADSPPVVQWAPDTPLSVVGMPHYTTPLLSATSEVKICTERSPLFQFPPRLDPHVTQTVRVRGNIGYTALPLHLKGHRNEIPVGDDVTGRCDQNGRLRPGALAAIRSAHSGSRVDLSLFHSGQRPDAAPIDDADAWSTDASGMASYYRQHSIQYSRFGVEDFDFKFYNKTPYSGLETDIANAYANSYLQALHYCRQMRTFATGHLRTRCEDDTCLLCEAGFLFRMLSDAKGANCQATNFLRAFSLSKHAETLGLLDTDAGGVPYSQLVQGLNHFLLESMSHGVGNAPPAPNPCAWNADVHSVCMVCGTGPRSMLSAHVVDLVYPRRAPRAPTLSSLVEASMSRDYVDQGLCGNCHKQTSHTVLRLVPDSDALPDVLSINACIANTEHLAYWASGSAERPFLQEHMHLGVGADGRVTSGDVPYRLRAVVVQVQSVNGSSHLCTFVRSPGECTNAQPAADETTDTNSRDESQAGSDTWYLFNDFLVRQVDAREALSFGVPWKTPAVLLYERVDDVARTRASAASAAVEAIPMDTSLLTTDINIAANRDPAAIRYRLLTEDELPKPGTLVAIDTEFVKMEEEELELISDGTRNLIRPSRLSLARVSVLRGEGPSEGVPFIDDHVPVSEPVVDYVTQFSGIHDGDLDPARSKYTLVPHKVVYKKLRMLVDMGCRFIGHGLSKDFRIVNIYVPPEQVVDTVTLYHSPVHLRRLSLRFLSWFLLKEHIQEGTAKSEEHGHGHDSIEDAEATLKLYRYYLNFVEKNRLKAVLEDLYEIGPRVKWRPPARD